MRLCNSWIPEEHLVCYQTSQRNWVIINIIYSCLWRCLLGWHRLLGIQLLGMTRPGDRVIPMVILDMKPMRTLKMAVHKQGPKAQERLKAHRGKPSYVYDLYCKASVFSHRAGHIVYKPSGTPWAAGRQPVYIKGRPDGGSGQETRDRKLGQAYSLPGNRDISNTTSNWIRPLPSPQGAEPV